ncbi:Hypothetical_protein [Hexamita inflata]|uniref:Hypothetical_protein n=1 Tax=Hexamita inflata TaxID=28002 RepID=A0AA86NC41_9EUKA|nr:Hypothetical protein HINF_LOCUS4567 [Hexamita inflata]
MLITVQGYRTRPDTCWAQAINVKSEEDAFKSHQKQIRAPEYRFYGTFTDKLDVEILIQLVRPKNAKDGKFSTQQVTSIVKFWVLDVYNELKVAPKEACETQPV